MSKLTLLPVLLFAACLSAAQPAARFDGDRAFEHVRKIVEIGPRPAGSEGAARTRAYITSQLKALGLTVHEQTFDAVTLDFDHPYVANAPITAVIESAKYNSDENLIDFVCLVPVAAGSLTKYPYYWPAALSALYQRWPVRAWFF